MHFTRKNIVGKNMIFSIQNSNAKRQPMNMTNPIHSASARLQFQYSKPNIRQNNHLMSTNMQYSVVKPKGQRLWSPVVHQKLKTRMYCNTVYECNPDYGTCSATTKGLQTYQDCSNTCHITNFYTCDASSFLCKLDASAAHDASGFKSTCVTNCFEHYDCCNNTGDCFSVGASGGKQLQDCSSACEKHTFGCDLDTGNCIDGGGDQTESYCSNKGGNTGGLCANFRCNSDTGECSAGVGTQTKAACEASGNDGGLCANFRCNSDTGVCSAGGGGRLTKAACEASGNDGERCANFGCDTSGEGVCKPLFGRQPLSDCSNAKTTCEKHTYGCDRTTGVCMDGCGNLTQKECKDSGGQDRGLCANFRCNSDTGVCSAGGGGRLTKAACEASGNVGGLCANFRCNSDTGVCSAGGGGRLTKAACEASGNDGERCANFGCDTSGSGACEPWFGTQDFSACSNAKTTCEKHTYGCDPTTGVCMDGSGIMTEKKCKASGNNDGGLCANFGCDTSGSGACEPGFGRQPLSDCSNAKQTCEKHTYGCDRTTEVCMDGSGTKTIAECSNNCVASCTAQWTDGGYCSSSTLRFPGTMISSKGRNPDLEQCSELCENQPGAGCCMLAGGSGGDSTACYWTNASYNPEVVDSGPSGIYAKMCKIPK